MKVKIEFEVNASTSKLLKCLYDRLDILHNDLINMDSNFKDFSIEIKNHVNDIGDSESYVWYYGGNGSMGGGGNGSLGGVGGGRNTSKECERKYIHLNFHHTAIPIVTTIDPDREECHLYDFGTCWGTKEKERCFCKGLKKFCTFFDGFRNNQKGE